MEKIQFHFWLLSTVEDLLDYFESTSVIGGKFDTSGDPLYASVL